MIMFMLMMMLLLLIKMLIMMLLTLVIKTISNKQLVMVMVTMLARMASSALDSSKIGFSWSRGCWCLWYLWCLWCSSCSGWCSSWWWWRWQCQQRWQGTGHCPLWIWVEMGFSCALGGGMGPLPSAREALLGGGRRTFLYTANFSAATESNFVAFLLARSNTFEHPWNQLFILWLPVILPVMTTVCVND